MLAIPLIGLTIQLISSAPESIAFARSGAVLVMFTILVIWSNHANQGRVSSAETMLQRHREIKESIPTEKIKEILSAPRIVEENDGRRIAGGSNEAIIQNVMADLENRNSAAQARVDDTLNSFRDEISTGEVISTNIKFAELSGGLIGTFIWGYGDWIGKSIASYSNSIF